MNILIGDIEEKLFRMHHAEDTSAVQNVPLLDSNFEKSLSALEDTDYTSLQKYVNELLEKYGPKRASGKVDTACFYEGCCISAATWSNFQYGKFSRETILKIIAGLECSLTEAEKTFMLAGFCLTNSRMDRLIKAALLSGHNNTQDMYDILEYYSEQYPGEVKNYYNTEK